MAECTDAERAYLNELFASTDLDSRAAATERALKVKLTRDAVLAERLERALPGWRDEYKQAMRASTQASAQRNKVWQAILACGFRSDELHDLTDAVELEVEAEEREKG